MGIKAIDLSPPSGGPGPTALTPPSLDQRIKAFQVSRTDTGNAVKAVLPAQCSVYGLRFMGGGTASNAGTTAAVTITMSNNTGVIGTFTAVDVKGAAAGTVLMQGGPLPNLENQPLSGDIQIKAVYAETGTASSAGGPWVFIVEFT